MKKFIILLLVLAPVLGFPLSNEDLRTLMDKPRATVGDALLMVSAMDDPNLTMSGVDVSANKKLAAMNAESPLTIGDYAVIAVELGKARGGLFYRITGLKRYAVDALQAAGLVPAQFAGNRAVSGVELIEMARLLGASNNQ